LIALGPLERSKRFDDFVYNPSYKCLSRIRDEASWQRLVGEAWQNYFRVAGYSLGIHRT